MDLVTRRYKGNGRLVVALESRTVAVVAVTVGFDNQSSLWPIEVDELALNKNVDLWQRQPGLSTDREEVDLRRRTRLHGPRVDFSRHTAATANGLSSPRTVENSPERSPAELTAAVRLYQQPLELSVVETPRGINQSPLQRAHRNAVVLGHVLGRQ